VKKAFMDASSLEIILYPHPTLRREAKPIQRVDSELRHVIRQMFPVMYASRGIGLAATQVNLPLRVFVINLASDPEEGEELVFINPVLSRPKGTDEKEEGCLSIPGVNANVKRPETVHVQAYDLEGQVIEARLEGLMARAVQHEVDHLDGVLFTDRLTETGKMAVREGLAELEVSFQSRRETGEVPSDEEIARHLLEFELRYA
jgi:peptide deformylase